MAKDELSDLPPLNKGIYQHYRGNRYEVLGVAHHTETLELMVVYRPLYDTKAELFVRPYDIFVDTVEKDGQVLRRFQKVDE